jgi:D-glycero-alpha-D-manno-heptose-7-phosphate kinase
MTATPYRISFFGGGTDFHTWFRENGGAIIGTTINHYSYLTCRYLPPFFKEKYRIVWSKVENTNSIQDILHPAVRGALSYMDIEKGVEIHNMSDLPARAGLGSSSSFSVGMLKILHELKGADIDKYSLAKKAIYLEQSVLKEIGGIQDQIHVAFGGFNHIAINPDGDFAVEPVGIAEDRKSDLQDRLLLFFTGVSRFSYQVSKAHVQNIPKKNSELSQMQALVGECKNTLLGESSLDEFGRLLHESWKLKRSLSDKISPPFIDSIYERGLKAGALGGKLLGAGGGGFILFYVPVESRENVLRELDEFIHVPFSFSSEGSRILYSANSELQMNKFSQEGVTA